MANHVSALKRVRQNEKARERNRSGRAANRTAIRKFDAAASAGTGAAQLPELMSQLAASASKGTIPKKRAARKIGRMARMLAKQ